MPTAISSVHATIGNAFISIFRRQKLPIPTLYTVFQRVKTTHPKNNHVRILVGGYGTREDW